MKNSSLQKSKPLKSKKNISYIKSFSCFVCGAYPTDADHIRSRGASGGDELKNLNALCRLHHIERHTIGIKSFFRKYYERIYNSREKYELPLIDIKFELD